MTPPRTQRTGAPLSSRACTTGAELRRLGGGADGLGGRLLVSRSGSGAFVRPSPPGPGASPSATLTSATVSSGFAMTPSASASAATSASAASVSPYGATSTMAPRL